MPKTPFKPSEALRNQARSILEKYPDMEAKVGMLSRRIQGDGDTMGATMIGREFRVTSRDLDTITDMIKDIAEGKTLYEGNPNLLIFKSYRLPKSPNRPKAQLPPRIFKCLRSAMDWCGMQMDIFERQSEDIISGVSHKTPDEAKQIAVNLHFLDEMSGLFAKISLFSQSALKEIRKNGRSSEESDRGGLGAG